MSEDALMGAVKEAWRCGYQQAVEALRDIASETEDEGAKAAALAFALILEAIKP